MKDDTRETKARATHSLMGRPRVAHGSLAKVPPKYPYRMRSRAHGRISGPQQDQEYSVLRKRYTVNYFGLPTVGITWTGLLPRWLNDIPGVCFVIMPWQMENLFFTKLLEVSIGGDFGALALSPLSTCDIRRCSSQ